MNRAMDFMQCSIENGNIHGMTAHLMTRPITEEWRLYVNGTKADVKIIPMEACFSVSLAHQSQLLQTGNAEVMLTGIFPMREC